MAGDWSNYGANLTLNGAFRGQPVAWPTGVKLRLYRVMPSMPAGTGGLTPASADYTDQPISFAAPSLGKIVQDADVTFTAAAVASYDAMGYGLIDQGENLLGADVFKKTYGTTAGAPVIIPAGIVDVSLPARWGYGFSSAVLNRVFRGVSSALPTSLRFALSTTEPFGDGTGFTPPVDSAYSHASITYRAPVDGVVTNDVLVENAVSTTTKWGLNGATWGLLLDQADTVCAIGPLATAYGTGAGQRVAFLGGELTMEMFL